MSDWSTAVVHRFERVGRSSAADKRHTRRAVGNDAAHVRPVHVVETRAERRTAGAGRPTTSSAPRQHPAGTTATRWGRSTWALDNAQSSARHWRRGPWRWSELLGGGKFSGHRRTSPRRRATAFLRQRPAAVKRLGPASECHPLRPRPPRRPWWSWTYSSERQSTGPDGRRPLSCRRLHTVLVIS